MENTTIKASIAVVVPVRSASIDALHFSRLSSLLVRLSREAVEIIVVDDGSPVSVGHQISQLCHTHSAKYERIDSVNEPFSLARARNAGAAQAESEFLFFYDVDLYYFGGFFEKLKTFIQGNKLSTYRNDFAVFPVAYLTPSSTENIVNDMKGADWYLDRSAFQSDFSVIEHYAPASSACLVSREYYLAIGGSFEEYSGWGFEDHDLLYRLVVMSNKYPLPRRYSFHNPRPYSEQDEYVGWRSALRLWGDVSLQSGLILYHLWHPVNEQFKSDQMLEKNRRLFKQRVAEFDVSQLNSISVEVYKGPPRYGFEHPIFDRYRYSINSQRYGYFGYKLIKFVKSLRVTDVLSSWYVRHRDRFKS